MTNRKTTKRALVSSAVAIVLCLAMLIGSTFAWFTDTASTGVNKIQAGNLDIDVSFAKEAKNADGTLMGELTEFKTIENATDVFDNTALWEPGRIEYVVFKLENKGSLALKYKFNVAIAGQTAGTNMAGDTYMLADYLCASAKIDEGPGVVGSGYGTTGIPDVDAYMAKVNDLGMTGYDRNATPATKPLNGVDLEGTLAAGKINCICMAIWMPETVGNEANARSVAEAASIDLGINVAATQYTLESDSFGSDYDADATYPVQSAADLKAALDDVNTSDTVDSAILVVTDDFTYENEELAVAGGKDITIDLAGKNLTINNTTGDGLSVGSGKLTLANSGGSGAYTFASGSRSDGIFVHNDEEGKTAEVTIAADVEIKVASSSNSAIHAYAEKGAAVVNIEDGAKVTVTGTSQTSAIIVDQNATLNIKGGEFDMRADFDSYSDGNDVVGILLWGQNGKQENSTVNISGGTFRVGGRNAFAQGIQIGMKNGDSENLTVNMTGGSIILDPTENGKGYAFTTYKDVYGKFNMSGGEVSGNVDKLALAYIGTPDLTVTGGTFCVDPSDYVDAADYNVTNSGSVWTVTAK